MKRHIPNLFTSANLFIGCLAIIEIFNGNFEVIIYFTLMCGLMDFFDGFLARILKVESPIGKDLDSLADLISFCAVPGFLIFTLVKDQSSISWLPYLALITIVLGALRLAKFNNDSRQSDSFHGVPVPAIALFICPLPNLISQGIFTHTLTNPYVLLTITISVSLLMVADFKMLALKFQNFSLKNNELKYIVIIMALGLFIWLGLLALPFIIISYVLMSVIGNVVREKNN